jgi:uncharacterized protein YbjT (DUF2867 family)
MRVLVIGGTGHLGGKIAREALGAGHDVVALVRPSSDASALARAGATIVRGDVTDAQTLPPALRGVDAVVTSAIGYVARKPGDTLDAVDDQGNRNVADAARAAGVRRLVFISILTADQAAAVPHFHQKFLSEQYFERTGVPFVSLRPGGFLDQVLDWGRAGLEEDTLGTVIAPDVRLTLVHADDVARAAVAALTAPGVDGARIDLGQSAPTTFRALAAELSRALGRDVALQYTAPHQAEPASPDAAVPPTEADSEGAASIAYMGSGRYVADVAAQALYFGPPPTLADSVRRWVAASGLAIGPRPAPLVAVRR